MVSTDLTQKHPAKDMLHCSYCGKSQDEVRQLIAGPTTFICDECVILCMRVIASYGGRSSANEFLLVLAGLHLRRLEEKNITLSDVVERHFNKLTPFEFVKTTSLREVLNAIGHTIAAELGTTNDHLHKLVETKAKLRAAEAADPPERARISELKTEITEIANDPPPIVETV